MNQILFSSDKHERFFNETLMRCGRPNDPYCRALFYLLGVCDETRRRIDTMYDFKKRVIKHESLQAPWQTGGTSKLTRLAFNLWNGWVEDDKERQSTPYNLFACSFAPYFWQAIKLRYPEYTNMH